MSDFQEGQEAKKADQPAGDSPVNEEKEEGHREEHGQGCGEKRKDHLRRKVEKEEAEEGGEEGEELAGKGADEAEGEDRGDKLLTVYAVLKDGALYDIAEAGTGGELVYGITRPEGGKKMKVAGPGAGAVDDPVPHVARQEDAGDEEKKREREKPADLDQATSQFPAVDFGYEKGKEEKAGGEGKYVQVCKRPASQMYASFSV